MANSSWESESPSTAATIWRILMATGIVSMLLTLFLFWRGTLDSTWLARFKPVAKETEEPAEETEHEQYEANPFPEEEDFLSSRQSEPMLAQNEPKTHSDTFLADDEFPSRRERPRFPESAPVSSNDDEFVTFDPNEPEAEPFAGNNASLTTETPVTNVSRPSRPRPSFGDDDASASPFREEPAAVPMEPVEMDPVETFVVEPEPSSAPAMDDDEPFPSRSRPRPFPFDDDVRSEPEPAAEPFNPNVEPFNPAAEPYEPKPAFPMDDDDDFAPEPFQQMGHSTENPSSGRPSMDDDDPFGGAREGYESKPTKPVTEPPTIRETGPFEVAPEMPTTRPRPSPFSEETPYEVPTTEPVPATAPPARRPSFDDEPFRSNTDTRTNPRNESLPIVEEESFEDEPFEEPVAVPVTPSPRPRPSPFGEPEPMSGSNPVPMDNQKPTFDDDSPFDVREPRFDNTPRAPERPIEAPVPVRPERPRTGFPEDSAPPQQFPPRGPQGAPRLEVQMTGPERVEVGQPVVWEFRITNMGNSPATGLVVRDEVPPALRHPQSSDLEYRIGTLAPGDSRSTRLKLTAVAPGTIINRAVAYADGGVTAIATTSLQIDAPAGVNVPRRNNGETLGVSRSGPKYWFVGQTAVFANRVENPNGQPMDHVEVIERIPEGVLFVHASNGGQYDPASNSVRWIIPRLAGRDARHLQVTLVPQTIGSKTSGVSARDTLGSAGGTNWVTEVHCPVVTVP